MSLAGCRVRLYGLNTTLLNAAEGQVTGPPDPTSGRHPIVLISPPEAVKGYPAGVKVQEKNLEVLKRVTEPKEPKAQQPSAGEPKQPKSKKQGASAGLPGPAQWAQGLTPAQQAEWLVDCYRMGLDDDYALGGCNLHGLYDPDHDPESIAKDFLVFCKLAVRAGVLPPGWDWAAFLRTAGKLLNYAFEKSDAQDKYGSENYFSAAMGGRSLRYTGEVVYGRNVMGAPINEESSDLLEEVEEEVEGVQLDGTATGQGLEDVGGIKIWKELLQQLQSQ